LKVELKPASKRDTIVRGIIYTDGKTKTGYAKN